MKSHKWIAGGITFLVSVALATSSFAAKKALNDKEMDQATAKGQSTVLKDESGEQSTQTINDKAKAKVTLSDQAQQHAVAGNVLNVAGENNVAATVNAAVSSGGVLDTIDQNNNIDQSKAAVIDQSQLDISSDLRSEKESGKKTSDSADHTESASHMLQQAASEKSCTLNADLTLSKTSRSSFSEAFPDGIAITGDISSKANANANGDATSTANADAQGTSTSTANSDVGVNKEIDGTKNTTIQNNGEGVVGGNISNGDPGSGYQNENDHTVQANVNKDHRVVDLNLNVTKTKADGDAAIAQSSTAGDQQAYGVAAAEGQAKAKSDASLSIDLPTAKSGSSEETFTLNGTLALTKTEKESSSVELTQSASEDHSTSSSEESAHESASETHADKSKIDTIVADHVKIGNGDQTINDETEYDITLRDDAQESAKALNIINVAGRNNVAVAWNLASSAGATIDVSPFISGGSPTTPGTIHQVNVVKQVN